jgi:hypothetical protein
MNRLFALFVAVNEYKSEDISTLRGCVKDIRRLESFLQKHYSNVFDLQIRTLENSDATYQNVIDTFRSHLKQAGPEDTVWFHFSGHGSEEACAQEFLAMEPNGKDQTLLCHDSQSGNVHNLADKELAAMLHEISTEDTNGNPKDAPHVVVSLDSCHSGSGTRDVGDDLIMPRAVATSGRGRSLDSYYNGFYASQSTLSVPISKHILLSACENVQTAGDTSQGGIFSTSLAQALTDTEGEINYVDLFLRARSVTKGMRKFQVPQFQSIFNFNPYTRFLTGDALGKPDKYEIVHEKGKWYIKCGAVHGLPTNITTDIDVEIRTPDPEDKLISKAIITSVGAQKSQLDVKAGFSFKDLLNRVIPGDDPYRGVIMQFPAAPFYVHLNETHGSLQSLKDKWDDSRNVLIAQSPSEIEEAKLEVNTLDGRFNIEDHELCAHAYHTIDDSAESAEIIMDTLGRIAKWYRTIQLKNENQHSKLSKLVEFQVQTEDKTGNWTKHSGSEIKIFLNEDNTIDNEKYGLDAEERLLILHPEVVIRSAKQDLFFYLLQFRGDYSILCDEDEVFFRYDASQHQTPYEITQGLWKFMENASGFGPEENESTTRFKLITTTEELDIAQLTQEGLFGDRSSGTRRLQSAKISNDWWVHNMKITFIRQDNSITPDQQIEFADGQLKVQPHSALSAKVSIANAKIGSRSTDPASAFTALQHTALNLMSFDTERSVSPRNVIELDQIKIDKSQPSLEEVPLNIELPVGDADDWTIPIIFDGQNFLSVGDSEIKEGKTVVHVREIPPVSFPESKDGQVENPFVPEVQDRSLFQTAKLAFFKLVLKKEEGINTLRRVEFDTAGGFKQTTEELSAKVNAAENILLIVHGYLGDSKSIIKDILAVSPERIGKYDLVLTFDYENLNQNLDDTASILQDQLSGIGFGTDQKLSILAHGSGGLVARWMIEQGGASGWVEKLTMVGTPNGGTVYGKVDTLRKFASSAMDTALNFIPDLIPGSGIILKSLRTLTDLTGSVAQMHPGSDFMNKLNSSDDPGVSYQIVSGNVNLVQSGPPSAMNLLTRISKKLGDVFQPGESHDMFSTVASMENRDAWVGRNPMPEILPTVASFHFNYFKNGFQTFVTPSSKDTDAADNQDMEAEPEAGQPDKGNAIENMKAISTQQTESLHNENPDSGVEIVQEESVQPAEGVQANKKKEPDPAQIVAELARELMELKKQLSEKEEELNKAIKNL